MLRLKYRGYSAVASISVNYLDLWYQVQLWMSSPGHVPFRASKKTSACLNNTDTVYPNYNNQTCVKVFFWGGGGYGKRSLSWRDLLRSVLYQNLQALPIKRVSFSQHQRRLCSTHSREIKICAWPSPKWHTIPTTSQYFSNIVFPLCRLIDISYQIEHFEHYAFFYYDMFRQVVFGHRQVYCQQHKRKL